MHPEVSRARARVAALSRTDAGDDDRRREARRDLNAAKIQAYIERALQQAPPLTDEQLSRLAELLRPVRVGGAQ
uniref:Putative phiRv1 phage protein n=1 Tax=Mycobacterium sp. (strain MCS) TaxID=164756 RepID=A0A5Q5BP97_MYCSS